MGDVPFANSCNFETACGKKAYYFPEDTSMYPVSYAFAVESESNH